MILLDLPSLRALKTAAWRVVKTSEKVFFAGLASVPPDRVQRRRLSAGINPSRPDEVQRLNRVVKRNARWDVSLYAIVKRVEDVGDILCVREEDDRDTLPGLQQESELAFRSLVL